MINHLNEHFINIFVKTIKLWWHSLVSDCCSKMPNGNKLLALKEVQRFSILLWVMIIHPYLPSPQSITVISTFSHFNQFLAKIYINIRKCNKKRKFTIVCFLKESNMDQNFYQGVKNINRQDVRINIIQIIGRLFT